jgi:hypothetical protein
MVYQLGRILSEKRSIGAAEGELSIGEHLGSRERVHSAVMGALKKIEATEGAPLEKIADDVRHGYSHELDQLLLKRVQAGTSISSVEIESALESLRGN